MVNYRINPEGKFIEDDDYRLGFGLDTSHYFKVTKAREEYNKLHSDNPLPMREQFSEEWDVRKGHTITGRKLNKRYHPLQELRLVEKETGITYHVDAVHKQHYMGYYIMLIIRKDGTKSHGTIYWENISCLDPIVLLGLQETKERFDVFYKKSFTIDGLGTIYQPIYAVYGDERRKLKVERNRLKSLLKTHPFWETINNDMYSFYGGEPKRIDTEERTKKLTLELKELDDKLSKPFNDEHEWTKIKMSFLSKKFEKINRLIEQGKEIPESLSKKFITFPLVDDPYCEIE